MLNSANEGDGANAILLVRINSKRYALPAVNVQEILALVEPTPVPSWPPEALGVINVRGQILPLMDVAPALVQVPFNIEASSRIVVVTAFGRSWGMLVDLVESVTTGHVATSESAAEAPADSPLTLRGITIRETGEVVVVIDPDGLFAPFRSLWRDLNAAPSQPA